MKAGSKRKLQIAVDIIMSAILLLQMSYIIAGELIHEITGISFFVLFIAHHILSVNYTKALFKGRKSAEKTVKLIVDIMLFIIIIMMMLSAVPISKYIFSFIGLERLSAAGRTVHLFGAYWGFALMNLHIGFHLDRALMKPLKDKKKKPPVTAALCILFIAGAAMFIKEGIYNYMFLVNRFVFFDESAGILIFLVKYILIGAMFAVLGFAVMSALKKKSEKAG